MTTQTHSGSPCSPAFGRRGWFVGSGHRSELVEDAPGSSTEGQVVERHLYDPYGRVTVLDNDWNEIAWSASRKNEILFAGYRYNPETGMYQARRREYHPTFGRLMQRDPLGYVDGGNLYAGYFVMWGGVDPWGLSSRRTYANIHFNYVGGKHYAFRGSDQNVPRGVNLIYMDLPYPGDNRPYVLQIHYDPTGDQQTPTVLTISLNNVHNYGEVSGYFQSILRQEHLEGALREIKEGANATLRTGDVIFDLVKCVAMVAIPGPELVVAGTVIAKFGKDWGPKGIIAVWNKATKRYDVQATPGSQVSQDELRQAAQALRNEFRKAAPKGGPHVPSGPMQGRRIGHTFTTHGSHNTHELMMRAKGSGMPQGQWIDDVAAERFIADQLAGLKSGAQTVKLPDGLGRLILPDGTIKPATHVRLVPSKSGVKTAYPMRAD